MLVKEYPIYWEDLTVSAKERLNDLYHENIDNTPIAIVALEETDEK